MALETIAEAARLWVVSESKLAGYISATDSIFKRLNKSEGEDEGQEVDEDH